MESINETNEYERLWVAETKLLWNLDLKNLIISCMDEPEFAQLIGSKVDYSYYWSKLIYFMKTYYNDRPKKPDYFIFLLLLTYTRMYIVRLNSFAELKIAFNDIKINGSSKHSDFTCVGYQYDNDNSDASNYCICSQQIENIYEFQNNISGVNFNVGSTCVDRHKVVSKNNEDYKLFKCVHHDRIIDKKNGCPEGYTHLQRLKIPPLLVSCDKKKITKIKNTDYITSTICYICNVEKTIILPPNSIPHICSCVSKTIKCNNASISKEILKNVNIITCLQCNQESRQINGNKLCFICKITNETFICINCDNNCIKPIHSIDTFCKDCIAGGAVKQCISCIKYIMHPEPYRTKCVDCFKQHKLNELLVEIICDKCDTTCDIPKEHLSWRKTCKDCYKKTKTYCEKCASHVTILKVKKDGPNNGKDFYKCKNCELFKWVLAL
jgi:hypothetical protein